MDSYETELAAPFDAAAATQAYLATVSGEARARSDAYFEGGYVLDAVGLGVSLLVAGLLLFTKFSAGLRSALERALPWRSLQVAVYAALFLIVTFVLELPWNIYRNFVREHAYGLSTQSFSAWITEALISLGVGVVLFAPFVVIFYLVLRAAPRSWWVWSGGLAAVFLAFVLFIQPVYVEPLFNEYTELEEGELRDDILSMARANGVPADNVYVFDTSRQSSRITANVAGLFGTTRIALSDNLLNDTSPAEIRAVMGHELGHYVLGHAPFMLMAFGLIMAVCFAFIQAAFGVLTRTIGASWGIRDVADVAGLPLIAVLFSVYFYAATPVINSLTRNIEQTADVFGLNAAREPDGFAAVAMRLSAYRKLDPSPLEEAIFFDHPSGRTRVETAMTWKAEQLASGAQDLDPAVAPLAPMVAEAIGAGTDEAH